MKRARWTTGRNLSGFVFAVLMSYSLHWGVNAAEKPIGDISMGMSRPKDPEGVKRRELSRSRVIELNQQIRPIFIGGDESATTPLPVSWWVEHCELREYAAKPEYRSRQQKGYEGPRRTSKNEPLTCEWTLNWQGSHLLLGEIDDAHLRLKSKDTAARYGLRGEITWAKMNERSKNAAAKPDDRSFDTGVYCRGFTIETPQKQQTFIQYYLFFGWNETDSPPTTDIGNHEADWICVEFELVPDGNAMKIDSALCHNHGRQVWVPRSVITFRDGRPVVYLERGTNEPWMWASPVGMVPGKIPDGAVANATFEATSVGDWQFGGESDDWSVVRQHEGKGPTLSVEGVTVIPDLRAPNNSGAFFVTSYAGWYGDDWHPGASVVVGVKTFAGFIPTGLKKVYVTVLHGAGCPRGPRYQWKMWFRDFEDPKP
jgi:hypothetical protein